MPDFDDPNYRLIYSDQPAKSQIKHAPGRGEAWLRYERSGRAGKAVTVIERLALSDDELKEFCRELKRICGVGGTVKAHHIELQGDCRERIKTLLAARGYKIKA